MTLKALRVVIAVAVVLAVGSIGLAQQDILNDSKRPEAERERDAGTKPLELYAFFGVESGSTVADLMPGGGYNTFILAKLVGGNGTVYAGPDRRGRLAERAEADGWTNVEMIEGFDAMPAGGVDVIITVRNVHDLINGDRAVEAAGQWLTALKPGGILGIVDARTPKPGFDGNTHRVNQDTVIEQMTEAGFELVEASEMLANPSDNFDESSETGNRYEIDRMTLKFRKPGM